MLAAIDEAGGAFREALERDPTLERPWYMSRLRGTLRGHEGAVFAVAWQPGGTMIASDYVARAQPDGYTLLMAASSLGIAPAIYTKVNYDPVRDGDYTGMCLPFGLMRSMNTPYPVQIMQSDRYIAFLFEQNTWFHVVPFRTEHTPDPNPTWFGDSIAKWDGDTLVIDTVDFNGYTRLDTRGNPHSDKLHLVQTFTRTNAGQIAHTVTIDDPVFYTRSWTNERTWLLSTGDLIEYSCEENNRSLWEGRIKPWTPPGAAPLRQPTKKN